MSIVSRSISSQPSGGGTVLASFLAIDSLGREWRRSRARFADEAAAEAASDAFDWTVQLIGADQQELLEWVQALNTVADFDFSGRDIDEDAGEEFIFQWFAESEGSNAITVAWWMDDINTGQFNSIRDRIGYTGLQGADITSRFTFMVAVNPWYDFIVEAP